MQHEHRFERGRCGCGRRLTWTALGGMEPEAAQQEASVQPSGALQVLRSDALRALPRDRAMAVAGGDRQSRELAAGRVTAAELVVDVAQAELRARCRP